MLVGQNCLLEIDLNVCPMMRLSEGSLGLETGLGLDLLGMAYAGKA